MKIHCTILTLLICSISFGQNKTDYFKIRNYKTDVAIRFHSQHHSFVVFSAYGKINYQSETSLQNYNFQGQEFDNDLGLYFFPARIYSAKERRFFQPDPKSQYFSPYLFVGADPINIIDKDGKEGKPIVLHHLETRPYGNSVIPYSVEEMSQSVDAYYISLPDFAMGNYPKPSDWNGNIFIDTHSSYKKGEIVSERYTRGERMRTSPMHLLDTQQEGREFTALLDPDALGAQFQHLSKMTGMPVKNISTSACEGKKAAKTIYTQAKASNRALGFRETPRAYGLKKGRLGTFTSVKEHADAVAAGDASPIDHPYKDELHFHVEKQKYVDSDSYRTLIGDDRHWFINEKMKEEIPSLKGAELGDLVNSRMPANMLKDFTKY